MIPDPLHPAVVHFPIALGLLLPFLAIGSALAIRRGLLEPRSWIGVVLAAAVLVGSGVVALETGEDEEEQVEEVVAHELIHDHEESAERLVWIAGAALAASAAGLLRGPTGGYGRAAASLLSLAVLAAAVQTGRLGGALVYEHGAASVYSESSGAPEREHEHAD